MSTCMENPMEVSGQMAKILDFLWINLCKVSTMATYGRWMTCNKFLM